RHREALRNLLLLFLVEDHDLLLTKWIPGRSGAALEGALVHFGVAPHHELGARGERATVQEPRREVRCQGLSVVGCRPGYITTIEGVLAGNRGFRVRRICLDVDEGLSLRGALVGVDVEVVPPEDVLVAGIASSTRREIAEVSRKSQCAVVD